MDSPTSESAALAYEEQLLREEILLMQSEISELERSVTKQVRFSSENFSIRHV